MRLTENQIAVLRYVSLFPGITKGNLSGADWRRVDRLRGLGLLEDHSFGKLFISESGRRFLVMSPVTN